MQHLRRDDPAARDPQKLNNYPFWTPRFWHGMTIGTWWKLLVRHRFRVAPLRWGLVCTVTPVTIGNSLVGAVQRLLFDREVDRLKLAEPPLFILGHWRSGTTHLHELLVLDDRHIFPTTYECFCPHHALLTAGIVGRWLKWLLPAKRPMDNMLAGWDRPQEDEFALCSLGLPSPYLMWAFPNDPPQDQEYLDFQGVPPADVQRWTAGLEWFLRRVSYRAPFKRIVLKSPTHTGRLRVLAEAFPDAKFIHLVRDPYALFPSTVRLWKSLDKYQGLQIPTHAGLDEYVLGTLERMYAQHWADREHVDPARIVDLPYEDLVRDPLGQLQSIYERLELGDFERVRPKVEAYLGSVKDYQRNTHELEPEIRAQIAQRWAPYFERYGYATGRPAVAAQSVRAS
jgi:hypothetical protein